jgi:tRNA U34 2-thiouridine synthase MnmA/TrmU
MSIITEQLAKSLFPIGALTNTEVREIATEMELITAERKIRKVCVFLLVKYVCQSFTAKMQQRRLNHSNR